MYEVRTFRDLSDEQIEYVVGEFRRQLVETRAYASVDDLDGGDGLIVSPDPERDLAQAEAIAEALNGFKQRTGYTRRVNSTGFVR